MSYRERVASPVPEDPLAGHGWTMAEHHWNSENERREFQVFQSFSDDDLVAFSKVAFLSPWESCADEETHFEQIHSGSEQPFAVLGEMFPTRMPGLFAKLVNSRERGCYDAALWISFPAFKARPEIAIAGLVIIANCDEPWLASRAADFLEGMVNRSAAETGSDRWAQYAEFLSEQWRQMAEQGISPKLEVPNQP